MTGEQASRWRLCWVEAGHRHLGSLVRETLSLRPSLAIGSEVAGLDQPARWACRPPVKVWTGRGNGVHGCLVSSQRGTGRSTPPAHLTRLCSFGRGHVCLPCHNWLSENRAEWDVACSRHATLPRENQIAQSCHKQAHTCLTNKYKWMCSPLENERKYLVCKSVISQFEHSGVSECAR